MVEGLTAEDGFDFNAGEGVFELPGGGLCLGFLYVAAPIEGYDVAGARVGGGDGTMGHFVDVFADGFEDAIEKADDLSSSDGLAIHYGVSMGGGDFDSVDVIDGVFHGLQHLVPWEFRDVGEEGSDALGLAAGGDDVEGFAGDFGGLARGKYDVGVVWQDDDIFRAGGTDCFQQFLGAGVHGALAGDYCVAAEIVKEADEAFAPGYGDDGEGRSVLLLTMEGEEALMLLADVIHLDANGVTDGVAVGDELIGFEGVDVDLGEGRVANDDEGATLLGEVAAKGDNVYVFSFDHKLGAESILLGQGSIEEFLAYGGHLGDGAW